MLFFFQQHIFYETRRVNTNTYNTTKTTTRIPFNCVFENSCLTTNIRIINCQIMRRRNINKSVIIETHYKQHIIRSPLKNIIQDFLPRDLHTARFPVLIEIIKFRFFYTHP